MSDEQRQWRDPRWLIGYYADDPEGMPWHLAGLDPQDTAWYSPLADLTDEEFQALAHVAAAAAGLRLAGPGEIVVREATLDEALQHAQLWQLNHTVNAHDTPHDDVAAEVRAKLIARLTAAPRSEEGQL